MRAFDSISKVNNGMCLWYCPRLELQVPLSDRWQLTGIWNPNKSTQDWTL